MELQLASLQIKNRSAKLKIYKFWWKVIMLPLYQYFIFWLLLTKIFVSQKESTKPYCYHRDMIDFYLSCTTNSGTLLSAGPFAEITLSNSKCVCFLKTASTSILTFFVVEPLPKAVLVLILGLSPPLDCTKGGNFWPSWTSKNRCIVLKHWEGCSSSFYGEMKCLLSPVIDDLLTLCLQSAGLLHMSACIWDQTYKSSQ